MSVINSKKRKVQIEECTAKASKKRKKVKPSKLPANKKLASDAVIKDRVSQEGQKIKGCCEIDINKSVVTREKKRSQSRKKKTKLLKKDSLCTDLHSNDKNLCDDTVQTKKGKIHKIRLKFDSIPKKAEDVSANWKKFLMVCPAEVKHVPTALKNGDHRYKDGKKKQQLTKNIHKESSENMSKKPLEIWFDDVDEILLEGIKAKAHTTKNEPLVKENSFKGLTKIVAMDCEMVGVGEGGIESNLARVSLVNQYGQCIYDKFVKPIEAVTDYRTHVSGIRPQNLKGAQEFHSVQKEVYDILKGRIVVGHAIENDFQVLYLDHPWNMIRDTSQYKPFKKIFNGRTPSLKNLSEQLLGVKVQDGEHCSVQDAQATMRLYTMYRKQWEKDLKIMKLKGKLAKQIMTSNKTNDELNISDENKVQKLV